jgi:beta-1,4-mannosyl-glycoprotein beta-1,4-N-acetylglucosaminyltransferase
MIIVQIGSNKGNDKLTEFIKNNNVKLDFGLFVEPVPFHITELTDCYKDYSNVVIENIAIKLPNDEKKEMVLYYHLDDGPNYEVASFSKDHILKHYNSDKMGTLVVPVLSLEELFDKYNLKKIDWLLIDVEGLDGEIVETFNWSKYDIKRIDVEHIHWGEKKENLFQKFYDMGYKRVLANDDRYDVAFEKNIKMKKYKVIDTFVFGGELDMLEMRLDYLYDSVDYFVISESNKTHYGQEKELVFLKNKHVFDKYMDKIKYVVYEPDTSELNLVVTPENIYDSDIWKLERGQRNVIHDKVKELSDENTLILHSDLDEFPDKTKFDELRELTKDLFLEVVSLGQPTYYYSPLNLLELDWYGTVVFNHQTMLNLTEFSSVREFRVSSKHLENAGWHFSFFNTPEKISYKIQTYAHQEFNTPEIIDIKNIKNKIYNGLDVLNRPDIKIKKLNKISNQFPIEFYRHEVFFTNTFDRGYLKPQQIIRKNTSMQIPLEIENLQLTVANQHPKVIVEIGTANGGTLARWLEIPSVETVISIDFPVGIHGGQGFEERTYVISDAIEQSNLTKKEFYAVNGDSKDPYLINRVSELLNGRKIDFLFIDGDHTYEGVKKDFEIYQQFLHVNSIVAFHDIVDSIFHRSENCFVSDFWGEIKQKYKNEEFIYTELLDKNLLPYFYDFTKDKGGFAGIGLIHYGKIPEVKMSLLVPVYNNVDLTVENIKTTIGSSKHIDEVIIYSNGTEQNENDKLLEFSKQNSMVKVFIHDKAIGFVKAVNEGIKRCKNELILCMNSDAHLYFDWEERLLPLCKNEKNGLIGPVLQDDFILGCAFIMKKSVLNKIGMLNEGFGMGYHDDGELTDRVLKNEYELGYCFKLHGYDEGTRIVQFPINHIQGLSFELLDPEKVNNDMKHNEQKIINFRNTKHIKVFKNSTLDDIKSNLNENDVFLVVNYSGQEFEKIRFDEDIVKITHIFECTYEMDIDVLINSICKGKTYEIIKTKNQSITWLAKYDDHTSMGILSQKVLENLKNTDVSCKEIIGKTETKNQFILNSINKPINNEIGIMFAYPDSVGALSSFKNKVIYTGVDTTGGIFNFTENCNKVDFLLTPSEISKKRMENLGVNKPIYVFPHGIDPNKFKFKKRNLEDKFKFLYVGECSDRKGIFHLLNAFTDLFKNNQNVELHLKSNSEMIFYGGTEVEKIINSLPNIFWHKSDEGHDVVTKLYDECHVYVYPTRADTFGMTIIEAMACGLPVISTSEPGSIELIKGRYYDVPSVLTPVQNHPWMLGEWGEPNYEILKKQMKFVYDNYEDICNSNVLEENSNFVTENYSWKKVTENFENNILPKLNKQQKIITLLTSYNRPHHIKNVINSFKKIRESGLINDVYIVDNSTDTNKNEIIQTIKENIDSYFTLHVAEFNYGQRGALLQMLEDVNLDEYDFIQFSDQDNIFNEPLSTYCNILNENQDITFVTGYMSKEHSELGWRNTRFGKLCEKRSLRAGHMFMRISDFKKLLPIHLDGQYGEPHNSSWNAGLDWELTYWNKNSVGKNSTNNFILCVPNGVIHKGVDSTFYHWDVEENEYSTDELILMRHS